MTVETETSDSRSHESPGKGVGAVILCGGQSSRMRFPKHDLWYDGRTFLQAVAHSVSQIADVVIVVVAFGEAHPSSLPGNVRVINDERPDLGPLEGIRTALLALQDQVPYAFVTSCDVPKLRPQLAQRLIKLKDGYDAVVPVDGERVYGMTAVYRTSLHAKIDEIYASGASRRVSALQAMVNARAVLLEDLKEFDPDLDSFANVNTATQYFKLLQRSGLSCPAGLKAQLSIE